jgi:hypothetical protein
MFGLIFFKIYVLKIDVYLRFQYKRIYGPYHEFYDHVFMISIMAILCNPIGRNVGRNVTKHFAETLMIASKEIFR